jgi:glutathione S-transferase
MVLKIFGRRSSVNVQKVMWLVGELELSHEHVPLGGAFGGLEAPDFLAMNPNGRVPVIDDDGVVVWESHAILRYLAAEHGVPQFWAEQSAQRAAADTWIEWTQSRLQPDFINGVFWGMYRTPEAQRDWPRIRDALACCARNFGLLDRALTERPFLGGDSLGLADIPAGSLLFRYFSLDIERPGLPNVEGWYARLKERAAFREHVMVDYSELRERLAF